MAPEHLVHILHTGSYDSEAPVLALLHNEYLPKQRLILSGKHHEVYLADPRRVEPDRLRTILRQPVQRYRGGGRGRLSMPSFT